MKNLIHHIYIYRHTCSRAFTHIPVAADEVVAVCRRACDSHIYHAACFSVGLHEGQITQSHLSELGDPVVDVEEVAFAEHARHLGVRSEVCGVQWLVWHVCSMKCLMQCVVVWNVVRGVCEWWFSGFKNTCIYIK